MNVFNKILVKNRLVFAFLATLLGTTSVEIANAQTSSRVDVRLRTFIPSEAINVTVYPSDFINGGDGRGFSRSSNASYRSSQSAFLTFDANGELLVSTAERDFGLTTLYNKDDGFEISGRPSWFWGLESGATPVNTSRADVNSLNFPQISRQGNAYSVVFNLEGTNPLPPPISVPLLPDVTPSVVPAFNANLNVLFNRNALGTIDYQIEGDHDGFPAYELYIDDSLVYAYDPLLANRDPLALFPPSDIDVRTISGTINPATVPPSLPSEPGLAFGTTNGVFDTIRPGVLSDRPTFIAGAGTNELEFGFPPNQINSFTFDGNPFQTRLGEDFVLGTFTYTNGLVFGSGVGSTYTTNLTISTNSPFAIPDLNNSLTALLFLSATENSGTPEQNADIIVFPNNSEFGGFRIFEGQTATVELLGRFGSLDLVGFGRVLSEPGTGFVERISVPESSSVLGIIAFSVIGGSLLLLYKPKVEAQ
jgi:hypothetical protein